MYRYIKVYGEARCERCEGRDEWWWGVSGDDVTWVTTSLGPLKCVFFMYICIYLKNYTPQYQTWGSIECTPQNQTGGLIECTHQYQTWGLTEACRRRAGGASAYIKHNLIAQKFKHEV